MDTTDLVESLNALMNSSSDLEVIIKAKNSRIDVRLAAILLSVSSSPLPYSSAVMEFILSLTDPEWDTPNSDPFDNPFGKSLLRIMRNGQANDQANIKPIPIADRLSIRLLHLARTDGGDSTDEMDLVLKAMTGKSGFWWIQWIRSENK